MQQKNILILAIIVIIVVLGFVVTFRKDIMPTFEEDEAILAEFCRKAVTGIQLRGITNFEGDFIFSDFMTDDSDLGLLKGCEIQLMGTETKMAIIFFSPDAVYETIKEIIKKRIAEDPEMRELVEIEEIKDIGEKAFLMKMSIGYEYAILFMEPDINQTIGVVVEKFDPKLFMRFARQVEKNLKQEGCRGKVISDIK